MLSQIFEGDKEIARAISPRWQSAFGHFDLNFFPIFSGQFGHRFFRETRKLQEQSARDGKVLLVTLTRKCSVFSLVSLVTDY